MAKLKIGKTQYLRTGTADRPEFITASFAGNIPFGQTQLTREQFGVQLEAETKRRLAKNVRDIASQKTKVRADVSSGIYKTLSEFKAGTGVFAQDFVDPILSKFQPDAPTPSEEFLKPEFKTQKSEFEQFFAKGKAEGKTPEQIKQEFAQTKGLVSVETPTLGAQTPQKQAGFTPNPREYERVDTGKIGADGKPVYDIFTKGGMKVSEELGKRLFGQGLNVEHIPDRIKAQEVAGLPSTIQTPATGITETPTLGEPEVGGIQDSFNVAMQSALDTSRATLENTFKTQIADLDKQIEESKKGIEELTTLEGEGIEDVGDLMTPFREKLENAERERLFINKNFQDNQRLTDELGTLLTEGNELIRQQKEITGLGAIRNPRIDKTISDVNARAGVIQAVMNARNGQINQAYNMIDRSISAINADKRDQLTYYNTLLNFYENQKDDEGKKLITLESTKRTFLNAQIGLLENDLAQSQANAQYIKELMIDPDSASFMAKAGISLNDTPAQINEKMANQSDFQEVEDFKNELTANGYEFKPFGGGDSTFSVGGKELSFKAPVKKTGGGVGGGGGDDPEPMSINQIDQFRRTYGWTPPFGYSQENLIQFMDDNLGLTPEQFEDLANKEAQGIAEEAEEIEAPVEDERASIEGITERINRAKDNNYSDDEIKKAIKELYSDDELFSLAKSLGVARFYTGKATDIDRMLNGLLK